MTIESKLVPIMREAIEVVRMVLFKKLGQSLAGDHPDRDPRFRAMLAGAMVNRIFAIENPHEPFASFNSENDELISNEIGRLATRLEEMRIPLTDALRMQTICDQMDGLDSTPALEAARDSGILIEERDLPLPHSFIDLVRRMGKALGLVIPPIPGAEPSPNSDN